MHTISDHALRAVLKLSAPLLGADAILTFRWADEETACVMEAVPAPLTTEAFPLRRAPVEQAGGILLEATHPHALLSRGILAELDGEPSAALVVSAAEPGGASVGLLAIWLAPAGPGPGVDRCAREIRDALAECVVSRQRAGDPGAARLDASSDAVFLQTARGERALRESQERFRSLIENASDGVAVLDEAGAIVYQSPAMARMLGYAPEALVGRGAWDFVHPDDLPMVLDAFAHLLETAEAVVTVEYRCLHRDGSHRTVESVGKNRLADPAVGGIVVNTRDVTEARRIEEELRRREQEFKALVENSPDIIARYDLDGRHTYVNPTIERLAGRPAKELIGRTNAELGLVPPPLVDRWRQVRERVAATRQEQAVESHMQLASGEHWFHGWIVPEFGKDGEVVSFFTVGRDITDRVRAEQALQRSQERFRSLIENAGDIILVLDAAGVVRYASPAVERLLDCPADQVVGALAFGFVHPEDCTRVEAAFARSLQQPRKVVREEARCRGPGTGWRTLELAATNLLDDPAIGGIVINGHDATERCALEAQLRQAQKMEAVGRLAGGVAHDFNNLLTGIKGYTSFLLADLPDTDPRRGDAVEIEKAADRAAQLTRQLLAFSRKQVLRPKLVDLNRVIADSEKLLRRLIGEDIELVRTPAPAIPPVRVDPGQIEQVIVNLAVNARDAMPAGGRLALATELVTFSEQDRPQPYIAPGTYVRIGVTDDGSGMSPETLARIFEPFFTTKPLGGGTGLGLSTVYGIVKQSDGYVWADSAPGGGSTFHVLLPTTARSPDVAVSAEGDDAAASGSGTVLIVEDSREVREVARRILQGGGYDVLVASDGLEALDLCRRHRGPIHVLLTDVVMPRMGGKEVADRITAERPETRVIYMTGYTDDAIVHHGVLDTGVTLVDKPFTRATLLRKVADVLPATVAT